MNAEDRRRAKRYGEEFVERLLALPPLARVSIEAETDRHGHIRAKPKIKVEFESLTEPDEEGHTRP